MSDAMITYEQDRDEIRVRVAGTITGRIRPVKSGNHIKGYRYHPLGSSIYGDTFKTIAEVKRSLESDDDSE